MASALPLPPADARRLAFFGSPEIAVPTLRALVEAGFDFDIVVTGHDKRRGRGGKTSPTPVKAAALELGLTVTSEIADAVAADVDLGIVVAFGKIIPRTVLEQLPMVNLHFSALPRWRGAAPIERAILAGDEQTAVSVITVAVGLDEGDIWAQEPVEIGPTTTADQLRSTMAAMGAALVVNAVNDGFPASVPQVGEPIYASKIHPSDLEIHWGDDAVMTSRRIRLGGAWTTFRGERLKIWEAEVQEPAEGEDVLEPGSLSGPLVGTSNGSLLLLTVQPSGKPRMDAAAWLNGAQPELTDRLGG